MHDQRTVLYLVIGAISSALLATVVVLATGDAAVAIAITGAWVSTCTIFAWKAQTGGGGM